MPKSIAIDDIREHRIAIQIIVDCYKEEEQAMGWYCYLDDHLNFPFQATCISKGESLH